MNRYGMSAAAAVALLGMMSAVSGCRSNNLWNVVSPSAEVTASALNSPTGAQEAWEEAEAQFNETLVGNVHGTNLYSLAEVMSDEYEDQVFGGTYTEDARISAQTTTENGQAGDEKGDVVIENLVQVRSNLLLVTPALATYESGADQATTAQAYALVGYTELLMAEDYCAGVPLDHALVGGGVEFDRPDSTGQLLRMAVAHFDTALLWAANAQNDSVQSLAAVGKGRALLDLGGVANIDSAGRAVAGVPVSFDYQLVMGSYSLSNNSLLPYICYPFLVVCNGRVYNPGATLSGLDVADSKGGVGGNFVSAMDPRLLFDSTDFITRDSASAFIFAAKDTVPRRDRYYEPVKFGVPLGALPFPSVPLATGVEAALIRAEAALAVGGQNAMIDTLQNLRQNASQTYLQLGAAVPAMTSGTMVDSLNPVGGYAALDILFRERAFWLFGLGSRLGDMRRAVRNYGVPVDSVYPNGPYWSGLHVMAAGYQAGWQSAFTRYGTDVDLTLPTQAYALQNSSFTTPNPYYVGCIVPTSVP